MNEKLILRSQFNGRLKIWKIVKKTFNGNGGWANLESASETYPTMEEADDMINFLVEMYPELYVKEVTK